MSTPVTMFKAMVFACAGMVLVFLLVGLLLAAEWRVDTTRSIHGSPAQVAALVTDLGTWSKWSAMRADLGPQTTVTVAGTPGTTGQTITWSGSRGTAVLRLAQVEATAIDYVLLSHEAPGPGVGSGTDDAVGAAVQTASGRIAWVADGAGCRVHWHDERQCQSLVERWFVWFGAVQEKVRQIQVGSLTGLGQALEAAGQDTRR